MAPPRAAEPGAGAPPLTPMLAAPGRLPPDDGRWAVELKWDGVRALVATDRAGGLSVTGRRGRDSTSTYPELAGLADVLPADTVLDGEVVTLVGGRPDFGALQSRMHVARPSSTLVTAVPVLLVVFDCLRLAGRDLLQDKYDDRRAGLDGLGLAGVAWQAPVPFYSDGATVLAASAAQGLEGVVAKRRDSSYTPGVRSDCWVKVKNVRTQEVVVGGWEPGTGGRAGSLGALLVGVRTDAGLAYAGQVGTGFTDRALADLLGWLTPLRRQASPFLEVPRPQARQAVWVEPVLVGEVAFTAWTRDGRLRHPSWRGLRADKDPAEVMRDEPAGR